MSKVTGRELYEAIEEVQGSSRGGYEPTPDHAWEPPVRPAEVRTVETQYWAVKIAPKPFNMNEENPALQALAEAGVHIHRQPFGLYESGAVTISLSEQELKKIAERPLIADVTNIPLHRARLDLF